MSAAADRDDDLQLVAIAKRGIAMTAARHDFTVFLDRDALAGKIERDNQVRDRKRRLKLTWLTVDEQGDHYVRALKSSSIPAREFTSRV